MGEQQEPMHRRVEQARHTARRQILQEKYKNKGRQHRQSSTTHVTTIDIDESVPIPLPVTKGFNRQIPNRKVRKLSPGGPLITFAPAAEIVSEKDKPGPIEFKEATEPFNPTRRWSREEHQDIIRATIAIIFVIAFVLTIGASFGMAYIFAGNKDAWPNMKDLIQIVITSESALLGGAVGFYFGEKVGRAS
jgi:hypothetical protein